MSEITALVKVVVCISVDGDQFQNLKFSHSFLKQGLSLGFMCSDQAVKYRMPRSCPLAALNSTQTSIHVTTCR